VNRETHQPQADNPDAESGHTPRESLDEKVHAASHAELDRLAQSIEARAKSGIPEERLRQVTPDAIRGPGGVLYDAGIPHKVVVRSGGVAASRQQEVSDSLGNRERRLDAGKCLYVFEDSGDALLVGVEPDRDDAIDWIPKDRTEPWKTRSVIVGPDNTIQMYVHPDGTDGWTGISAVTGQKLHFKEIPDGQLARVYLSSELMTALAVLAELQGFITSGKLESTALQQLLKQAVNELHFDFVDLQELVAVHRKYGGRQLSFIDERNFEAELTQASKISVKREIDKIIEMDDRSISSEETGQLLILDTSQP